MTDINIHLIKYKDKTHSFDSFINSMKFVSTIYKNLKIENNTKAKEELKIFHAEISKRKVMRKPFEKIDDITISFVGFQVGIKWIEKIADL